jgi:hypothetical protein
MTPEKAFLVRVFTKYCVTQKEEARLEGKLPVVTGFAFKIQGFYNKLRQLIESDLDHDVDEEAQAAREEARMDLEFVLGEMLRIAMYLDYGDEMGRRRMFQLVSKYDLVDSFCLDLTRCGRGHDLAGVLAFGAHAPMLGRSAQAHSQRERAHSYRSRSGARSSRSEGARR